MANKAGARKTLARSEPKHTKRWLLLIVLLAAILNPYTQAWIASQYVVADPLENSDAVIAMRGSAGEERRRLDHAAELVRQGRAPILLISAYAHSYYGHPVSALVADYLRQQKLPAAKIRFCENLADSSAEEALSLRTCLQQLGAKSAIVVTSEYHTRRTRFLFRRILSPAGIQIRVHPLYNAEYWDSHWWRRRRWAKTFLIETISILGNALEQWLFFKPRKDFPVPTVSTATTGPR